MKYLFFIFFCCTTVLFSQTGKITYNNVLNYSGSKPKQVEGNLYFNSQESIYINLNKTEIIDNNTKSGDIIITNTDSIGYRYYHNLQSKKFICRETVLDEFKLKYYIYEDYLASEIQWKLSNEFKLISDYNCQKAIGEFRGRIFEAWFTPDIPLPYGPWKLGGLPGLILEVYDSTHEVYFSAEQIIIPYEKTNGIINEPRSDPKISQKEFVQMNENSSGRISKALLSRMPEGAKITSIQVKRSGIELEYEWEKK
ncbi:GLPGLI family protein [Aequorivita sp. F47161]|uniref:GLPGLI family protein n=1 Tax=Aequorivita vitellina TaxID=2874475 RepID=A0A9X1UBA1_9FLAO|nr:GLPGLI family protein [Aequorivita vitellina]MCG2420501.1 GLPGLI family protein [Aequorivita vitellina]